MTKLMTDTPVVMSITNNDPTGGAGIAADIETLCSLGCHCTPIVTSLSVTDTISRLDTEMADTGLLIEQIRGILEDINVNLINIGNAISVTNIEAIHTILQDYPSIPVVLHPHSGDTEEFQSLKNAVCELLVPLADVLILSKNDAETLCPEADTLTACAAGIMEYGCNNILITDSAKSTKYYTNNWYSPRSRSQQYQWQRLPHSYHGAMSTLAGAVSGYLAHGLSVSESLQQGQQFTWNALQKGRRISMGDLFPDRMHWCWR